MGLARRAVAEDFGGASDVQSSFYDRYNVIEDFSFYSTTSEFPTVLEK